ncbi:thioredoxin 1 [Fusarium albosuccineum]|uniref:Thioredoxin 1 n=1 Tax=Fusarium albosuccineum TaxID=1237068 RepID=A0A8H4KHP8_9HYPO|nr:thioredoxin 1 [Fusarium albosuccineum]
MAVVTLTSKAQFDELINKTPYVVIQAHATWCGPCKAISPIYNKHAEALTVPNKYAFAKFDTDDVPDLAFELGIRSIPAFFFFENGDKDKTLQGANPPALKERVEGYATKANGGAAEDKPAEDKPAEEKPAEDKPAEDKPAEDKPAEGTLKTDENF